MREMPASAQQSTLAVQPGVTVSDPVPDSVNPASRPIEPQAAAAAVAAAETATVAADAVTTPAWRLATVGLAILTIVTALDCFIPRFLKPGFGEDLFVLFSILALMVGAALVTACFVRNMIRKL
jgi:4-amino-4-deoxy-L-arabinose transferase-like glycosyltransferase